MTNIISENSKKEQKSHILVINQFLMAQGSDITRQAAIVRIFNKIKPELKKVVTLMGL